MLVHLWKFEDDADRRQHWAAVFADTDFMAFAGKLRPHDPDAGEQAPVRLALGAASLSPESIGSEVKPGGAQENLHERVKIMCDQLAPCGNRPNCVCSRDDAPVRHRVEPFAVSGDPEAAFARLKNLLAGMSRTAIATSTDEYVHAVCRTRLGFADDLKCCLYRVDGVSTCVPRRGSATATSALTGRALRCFASSFKGHSRGV